jgi:hypothetical protein
MSHGSVLAAETRLIASGELVNVTARIGKLTPDMPSALLAHAAAASRRVNARFIGEQLSGSAVI